MTASGCSAKCFSRQADPWVLRRGRAGRPASPRTGLLVEFDQTDAIFTHPADRRTEDYVTGRFG
jgi:phosphate transport system ATP-binding protein